ncbi:MAG: ZIP family metal transporter [Patescibacteria group bacterium]
MTTPLAYALLSTLIVSLISLIGIFIFSKHDRLIKKSMHVFIGLAAGALLGDAFIHLIPEVFEAGLSGALFAGAVLSGIVLFFFLEKYLRWYNKTNHHKVCPPGEVCVVSNKKPLGLLVLFGDGVHNFIDGGIIAASYFVSIPVGIATTVAVFLHEVPQEVSDYALLLHSGYTRAEALFWNFISAITAFLGIFAFLALGDRIESIEPIAIALTAGGFIYIAAANLVPELQKTHHPVKSAVEFIAVIVGIGIMFALLLVE